MINKPLPDASMTSRTTPWPELVPLGPGRARAVLDRSWWSWAGPHGGLLGSLLLRTAQLLAGDREPRALSVHYLSALAEGPVEMSAALLREGGSSAVVRADLRSVHGTLAATAIVTSGRAARRPTASYDVVAPPPAPPPEQCEPLEIPPEFGWVLTRIATRTARDGWCVDDSEVWSPNGQLLAQARQVRRVLGELA